MNTEPWARGNLEAQGQCWTGPSIRRTHNSSHTHCAGHTVFAHRLNWTYTLDCTSGERHVLDSSVLRWTLPAPPAPGQSSVLSLTSRTSPAYIFVRSAICPASAVCVQQICPAQAVHFQRKARARPRCGQCFVSQGKSVASTLSAAPRIFQDHQNHNRYNQHVKTQCRFHCM